MVIMFNGIYIDQADAKAAGLEKGGWYMQDCETPICAPVYLKSVDSLDELCKGELAFIAQRLENTFGRRFHISPTSASIIIDLSIGAGEQRTQPLTPFG